MCHKELFYRLNNWVALFIFMSCLLACSSKEQKTIQQTGGIRAVDVRGVEVWLEHPAERIVVLFQASLDGLYMLNAEKSIVGIQQRIYSNPENFKYFSKLDPRIANKELATPGNWENSTNLESVLALRPDLMIMPSAQIDAITALESMGIAVFAVSPTNNELLFKEIEGLGKLTGTSARATELIEYTNLKLKEIEDLTSYIEDKKKVYYAWSGGRIYSTSGKNSRMNECFELAGVQNVCPFDIDTPNINPETLINWDPDLFLLWNSDPEELYKLDELQVLRAVKEKQVHVFSPPFFYDPHTLKIMYMALELHQIAYSNNLGVNLDASKKELMQGLYGQKANRLFE